jgi:hypothetical protein
VYPYSNYPFDGSTTLAEVVQYLGSNIVIPGVPNKSIRAPHVIKFIGVLVRLDIVE